MRKSSMLIIFVVAMLIVPTFAQATAIFYDVTDLGGGVWKYDYTVQNDTLISPIMEFTIWFDYGLYDALFDESTNAKWFTQTADPTVVLGVPQDGFYNAISLAAGIAPGTEDAGFSVSFVWLFDPLMPSFQRFDIVENRQIIDSGLTQPLTPQVPEPGILLLFVTGLIGLRLSKAIMRP